ncbi:hypothetical protein AVEN_42989-1 [Araneus ventricosus]|uniref:Uncharacterized protein n=1 Tax=Araneus ventricosus TaxID=182803 RepID=A0A4Y2AFE2_ARAVE|nr:hypothetical protein AVEN_42989-1 [Araneus ventricosus]
MRRFAAAHACVEIVILLSYERRWIMMASFLLVLLTCEHCSEGVAGAKISRRLTIQYGESEIRNLYQTPKPIVSEIVVPRSRSVHLSGPLEDESRLPMEQEIQNVMHQRLIEQPQTFFFHGIRKLVDSWTKCIAKAVDSVD